MTSFSFVTVSEQNKTADCFVTHSWMLPSGWEVIPLKLAFSFLLFISSYSFFAQELFGKRSDYGETKSTELALVCEDLQELSNGEIKNWRTDVTFWVDKACIPQRHTLTSKCVERLDQFILRCKKMVLFNHFCHLRCKNLNP